jgi:hypothetical protein
MKQKDVLHLLEVASRHAIKITIDDGLFGQSEHEYSHTFIAKEVDGVLVILDGIKEYVHDFDQILKIEMIYTENDIIGLIENSRTLEEAFNHSKHLLTPKVEQALDEAKERLKDDPNKQEEKLLKLIEVAIKSHKATFLEPQHVYAHICRNTMNTPKIEKTLSTEMFIRLTNEIPNAIVRLSDMPF